MGVCRHARPPACLWEMGLVRPELTPLRQYRAVKAKSAALSPLGVHTIGPTIHDLPEAGRSFLLQRGTQRTWNSGEEMQAYGATVTHACWLMQGRLRCTVTQADGNIQSVGWLMQDELFNVANLMAGDPSRVTLVADTDATRVLMFDRPTLLALINEVPGAGEGIAMGLSRRMLQLHDVIAVLGFKSLLDKLRAVLFWWTKHYAPAAIDGSVELWVSQSQLAEAVGASRQRVHLELQQLRDLGEIDIAYRKVIVRKRFFEQMQQPRR